LLLVQAEPAPFQQTLDRLLMIEASPAELTISSTAGALAIAQQEESDAVAWDYRFARPDVAELTIELAT
jgi:hypothetical protein